MENTAIFGISLISIMLKLGLTFCLVRTVLPIITAAICDGHNADDLIEFGDFLGLGETYTNQGFYEFIHPWNEDLPYLYDEFSFDYCQAKGFDFSK
jgi:hypothetical protein